MRTRLRAPLFSVVALNLAFSVVFDEATDTKSEDTAEIASPRLAANTERPTHREQASESQGSWQALFEDVFGAVV